MKKSLLAALIAVIALVALITSVAVSHKANHVDRLAAEVANDEGENPALSDQLASYIPADAYLVSAASASENLNAWWDDYAAMEYNDPALPQLTDNFDLISVAYAQFPSGASEGDPGAAAVFLRFDGQAAEFQSWMAQAAVDQSPDPETSPELVNMGVPVIAANDDIAIVPFSIESYDKLANNIFDADSGLEKPSISGFENSADWAEIAKVNDTVLWWDAEAYLDLYIALRPQSEEVTRDFLMLTAGWEPGTRFLASSVDEGDTWNGYFISGGMDTSKVDLTKADQMVADSVVISENGMSLSDEGLLPITSVISTAHKLNKDGSNTQVFGAVTPAGDPDPVVAEGAVEDDFRTSIVFSPQMFESLFTGFTAPENVSHLTLDITENNSARLAFHLYGDATDEDVA